MDGAGLFATIRRCVAEEEKTERQIPSGNMLDLIIPFPPSPSLGSKVSSNLLGPVVPDTNPRGTW